MEFSIDTTNNSDFTIKLIWEEDTYKYNLHKSILCKCGYFEALFNSKTIESNSNSLTLSNFTGIAFHKFLLILYGKRISIDIDDPDFEELVHISYYFDYLNLTKLCAAVICRNKELLFSIMNEYPQIFDLISGSNAINMIYNNNDYVLDAILNITDCNLVSILLHLLSHRELSTIIIIVDKWSNKFQNNKIWNLIEDFRYSISSVTMDNIIKYKHSLLIHKVVYINLNYQICPSMMKSDYKFEVSKENSNYSIEYIGKDEIFPIKAFHYSNCPSIVNLTLTNKDKVNILIVYKGKEQFIIFKSDTNAINWNIDPTHDKYELYFF